MPSLGSLGGLGGSGWLEKLKRGFEAAGRVVASLARVGRNERLSSEATLAPLTILHEMMRQLQVTPRLPSTAFLPLLCEIVWPLPGAQRRLGPCPQCWRAVVAGGQRAGGIDGVGRAGLAQPAAIVARLLELADSVFCSRPLAPRSPRCTIAPVPMNRT